MRPLLFLLFAIGTVAFGQQTFRAIGLKSEAHQHVRLRASHDGLDWTEWQQVIVEPEHGGTLVWFGGPYQYVDVDAPEFIEVVRIDPGETPMAMRPKRAVRTAAAAAGDQPEIVPRSQWCPANDCPSAAVARTTPTHLIVHHSAGSNTSTDWPAVVRSIWTLHVRSNGWADIGYNYLVDPNGVIYEGRGDGILGAHFSGVNTGTMGVCYMGIFSEIAPPPAGVEAMQQLLAWQLTKYNLDPLGLVRHSPTGSELNVISGHRDGNGQPNASTVTQCPGNGLYVLLPRLRRALCAQLQGCRPAEERENPCAGGGESPCLVPRGVLSTATWDDRPVVRGSIVAVYGERLGDVTATVNGVNATVVHRSTNQVNLQVPNLGNLGTVRLRVQNSAGQSAERLIWMTEAAPGLFATADNRVLGVAEPVRGGDLLSLFATGAGATVNASILTPAEAVPVTARWSVMVGGRAAEGLYLGWAPGLLGVYQLNLRVPPDLDPGDHAVVLEVAGALSNAPLLTVW